MNLVHRSRLGSLLTLTVFNLLAPILLCGVFTQPCNGLSGKTQKGHHHPNTIVTPRAVAAFALTETMIKPRSANRKNSRRSQQNPQKTLKIAVRQLERIPGFLTLDDRDRAFARLLLSTTERRMGQIDKVLEQFVRQPLSENHISDVLCQSVLRIGAAQLLFLDVPIYAAVKEMVDVLRSHPKVQVPQTKVKFVNAILRRVSERGLEKLEETSVLDNLHPWLSREWIETYGEDRTLAMVTAAMQPSPVFVSVNRLYEEEGSSTTSKDANAVVQEAFSAHMQETSSTNEEGSTAEVLPVGCIRVPSQLGGTVSKWPLYEKGAWWVQDPSATLPALALYNGLKQVDTRNADTVSLKDKSVVDLCSAPGGKTAQLCTMGFQSVDAVELSQPRTKVLRQNLKRLKLEDCCSISVEDGRLWLPHSGKNTVDGLLLDAPCSATGLGSRRPDVLTKSLEDDRLEELITTQRQLLLHAVQKILKPGGVMVYATCSLQRQEGEDQIQWLLSQFDGRGSSNDGDERNDEMGAANAVVVEVLPFLPGELPGFDQCITNEGWLRVLPGTLDGSLQFCDGFFVTKLVVSRATAD